MRDFTVYATISADELMSFAHLQTVRTVNVLYVYLCTYVCMYVCTHVQYTPHVATMAHEHNTHIQYSMYVRTYLSSPTTKIG